MLFIFLEIPRFVHPCYLGWMGADWSDLIEPLSRLSRHKQQHVAGERRTTLSSQTNAYIPIYPYTVTPT